jgi:hypothetical protein
VGEISAYAPIARIKNIPKEKRDLHLSEKEVSEIDETDEKGKLSRLAVNRNKLAIASFYGACTENWPDGEAHLVVRELHKRYRPLDTVSRVEMRQHLSLVKMKKVVNPSELFETLNSIRTPVFSSG